MDISFGGVTIQPTTRGLGQINSRSHSALKVSDIKMTKRNDLYYIRNESKLVRKTSAPQRGKWTIHTYNRELLQ